MTTTNIAGIEFPDEMLPEAAAVADALDRITPDLNALLDRAAAPADTRNATIIAVSSGLVGVILGIFASHL